jgi:hypothetical protein
MKPSIRTYSLAFLFCLVLAAVSQASDDVNIHWGSDWRKMSPKMATTKAVEAMVLKNNFIRAETQGNVVIGWNETAKAVVQAIPCRDGVEIIFVVVGENSKEAERLRNAIRTHVFDGPYNGDIPATLDSKIAGRKSTAPELHIGGAVKNMSELLFEAAARSSVLQHGLTAGGGGTSVCGVKKDTVVVAFYTPMPAAGQAYLTIVAASSQAGLAEKLRNAVRADIFAGKLPAVVDLCKYQSPIRSQGARGACPYFPPIGALEAAYRHRGVAVDLSVEHLIWLRDVTALNEQQSKTVDKAENLIGSLTGGGLGNSFDVLTKYRICRAEDMPYVGAGDFETYTSSYYKGYGVEKYSWDKPFSQFLLNRWNMDPKQFPQQARDGAKYGIEKYVIMPQQDLKNVGKFEQNLASGREVVWSLGLHDDIFHTDPAQPVWRLKPGSKRWPNDNTGHLTLIVGYDRTRKFFIVKNSWGPTNYSATKDKLAVGWKDIVRYDGYTLVDYNYLAECSEAGYITEPAAVNSPRFAPQRAMGQWQVTFADKSTNHPLMTGVLSWRRMPNTAGLPKPDLRIGDLVTKDGKQFRVNAKLQRQGVTLIINFTNGALPYDAATGTAWSGKLTLPESGQASMSLTPQGGSPQLWGVSASNVQMTAAQVSDGNLLKTMLVPH